MLLRLVCDTAALRLSWKATQRGKGIESER